MEETFAGLEEEFAALQRQEKEYDQTIEQQCQELLHAFWRRFPPLQQVPELILTQETLRQWLDQHPEQQP